MKRCYRNPAAEQLYTRMLEHPEFIPFSFVYDHQTYSGFSAEHFVTVSKTVFHSDDREHATLVFALDTLEITVLLTHYPTHGVNEFTVWFENKGNQTSKTLSDLKCFMSFEGETPVLRGILGDYVNQYRPYTHDVTGEGIHFESNSGRPTHVHFPYFNLEYGTGGVMLAIGWAVTWTADFKPALEGASYSAKCINNLNTVLKPNEKIRTALFVAAYYTKRSEQYATNYWRDWFVRFNLPKANASGDSLEPFSCCCLASDTGLPNSDGSISERYFTWRPSLERMIAENCKVDFRWFDAGWYVAPDLSSPETDWWGSVGTWVLDPQKWPGTSFLESTEYARKNGMKTLMWFEPERVTDPDNLAKHFGYRKEWAIIREGTRAITNNIGDAECLAYTTERICKTLRENKVEMYREDNNSDPASLWAHLDSLEGENRSGITESKFVIGHYRMWDDIIACTLSYGGCGFVDSCASGGGRNDLESLRRGVPLLRSDSDRTSTALRLSMTTSFNQWIPFCGANTKEKLEELALDGISDVYTWRASYLPCLNVDSQFVYSSTQNFDILRFGLQEWDSIKSYLLKDFYVLTPWHSKTETDDFTAFCYVDPEDNSGILLAFRQENTVPDTLELTLPFSSETIFTDKDTKQTITTDGRMLTVRFSAAREARLYRFRVFTK